MVQKLKGTSKINIVIDLIRHINLITNLVLGFTYRQWMLHAATIPKGVVCFSSILQYVNRWPGQLIEFKLEMYTNQQGLIQKFRIGVEGAWQLIHYVPPSIAESID